jgi:predicted ester cyclase
MKMTKPDLQLIRGGLDLTENGQTVSPRVRELIRLVQDAFNEGDVQRIEQAVSEHMLEHIDLMGHVDFRQRLQMLRRAIPDAKLEIDEVIQHGNLVAWRWTITGTHADRLFSVEPTDRRITLTGISLDRLGEDEKVVEHWEFPDVDAFYAQFQD